MDEALARWLTGPEGHEALAAAAAQPDPGSLAAAQALRRSFTAEQAAAASRQEVLRRRAVTKFGERAGSLFFTADGLEQATRAPVATWRADRFIALGATRVVDLGCGLGADALALTDAGLAVVAVEADPVTAVFAAANLRGRGEVVTGDAVEWARRLLQPGDAVFLDPARRTSRGRTWRVADVSPPWEFATGLLRDRPGCLKAGPGISSADLPSQVARVWVSEHGDLVEASLWSGVGDWPAGSRRAVLLPAGEELVTTGGDVPGPPGRTVAAPGAYLYEPDPAVIRAGGVDQVAALVSGWRLAPHLAYLASDALVVTPFATAFAVAQVLPYDERALRAWVRQAGVGTLEIKVRGIDIDPAALRRRLKPTGRNAATLILTPTPHGARALVARRV
ncbi:MAG: class I SAM-dependent methyltransferase [Propionicimonas sp.]|uniref:class I SAM-dependent methyltransferase n=1 Tax=Propionicimonas sp. TaxID=1955623 RepID=UPI002B217CCD|nr:class I SAM-dependent methyltransferase [Propionicimonas sp.]MEA4943245.1 class I SAM-dependent methyltransferase [Propionicimonas sp.]